VKAHQGFTLVELLTTIAVAAVLLGLATPSFMQMTRRNRVITYANEVISTTNLARSEAIRRGLPVIICHSSDQETCSGTWSDGWITYVDLNSNSTQDDDEPVLRIHEGLQASYTINASAAFADQITYGADGGANDTGVFIVCHDDDTKGSRAVLVARLRPRVAQDSDNDGVPNLDLHNNVGSCTAP
jgi:type IV fimbrial biogenesis protein FimT